MTNNVSTAYSEVLNFVKQLCSTKQELDWDNLLQTDNVAKTIYEDVKEVAKVGIHGHYFRGRPFGFGEEPKMPSKFGPPKRGTQLEGRYSEEGKSVLYLCRNIDTGVAEVRYRHEEECLYIQEFDIQSDTISVIKLDADLEESSPHVHYLLLESEYAVTGTNAVKFPYRATQFIAEICKRLNIGAVEYPSIKGDYKNNKQSVNMVVFDPYYKEILSMYEGEPTKI